MLAHFRATLSLTCAALLAPALLFAEDKKWEAMDYGRFLSATLLNPEGKSTLDGKGSATNKGVAVKLGEDASAAMVFDTECVRMAGGWTGGWLKLKGVAFDGGHGPNPGPVEKANVFFQTNPGPTWSKGDNFQDPRKVPTGPGAATIPLGPLPRDWAKYRGLYLSGDNVVFAYTVGEAALLEMPALEKIGETSVLTRTFQVVKPGAASSVILAEGQNGATAALEGNLARVTGDSKDAGNAVLIAAKELPAGAQLVADGARVILKLPAFAADQTFKIAYAKGAETDLAKLATDAQSVGKPADLRTFTKGGPAHWKETVTTKGELGNGDKEAYVLDTIGVPLENPYKAWMRIGAIDFFADGRAAVSTWSGDVWIVSGLDEKLQTVQWKRYATGLFHALGLKIVDGQIFVLGRDQITKLQDVNGDGEADVYENFNNDVQVTPGFHEFAFDLQTDPEGNFYFSKGGPVNPGGRGWGPLSDHNGCIFKISRDGQKFEVFATGVRAPNGMAVGPNGEVTMGDNQGTWVPACYVHWAKQPGDFVGVVDLSHRDPLPTKPGTHICYIPMNLDNSGGGQVWVTSDKWGPMKGRLLHLSYGKSALFGTMIEQVNGVPQGGVFRFPFKFDTGSMRGRFSPIDGQLYVVGLKGWQTDGAKDAAFQRVRYTGKKPAFPAELHYTDAGIHLKFLNPLETSTASDPQNYSLEQWNYQWTKEYGSPDFKVSDPKTKGRDALEVKSVRLGEDKKSVFLEVPGLQPVDQISIKLNIKAEDGSDVPKEIVGTINVVAPEKTPGTSYTTALK